MRRQIQCLFTCFFLFAVLAVPDRILAGPYYEGKMLKIIVAYEAGGSYDKVARLLAKHLPKYIPGKPNVIVENMPGGGSKIATNYLYGASKPDGLTIGTFARSQPLSQLIKAPGIKFDLTKFSWIGSPIAYPIVLAIRSDLPYKNFSDLLKAKEPIYLGSTGVGLVDSYFPLILSDYLGLKVKIIQYKGGSEIYLAIERKELDGWAAPYTSLKPHIIRGLLRPILRGVASVPEIDKLPANVDFTTNETARTLMTLISVVDKVGQPYVAPPGTPTDIINILKDAFSKCAKDRDAQEEAVKGMFTIEYLSGEESLKVVNYVLNQPAQIVKELNKYLQF
jgi:tripartite-type tricarboxylate transporter receptor subunit TctC